jgi:hypothetical protein
VCVVFLKFIDAFMALCFMGIGAPLATRHLKILPMNQQMFGMKCYNSQITGGVENAFLSTRRYFLQLIVSLKNVQHSSLHLQHTRHQLSLDGLSKCYAVLAQTLTLQFPKLDISVIF